MTVAKEKLQILSACWWTRSRPEERTFQAGETVVPRVGECFLGRDGEEDGPEEGNGIFEKRKEETPKDIKAT